MADAETAGGLLTLRKKGRLKNGALPYAAHTCLLELLLEQPAAPQAADADAPPGLAPSAHIGVYLPTSGREPEFLSALTALAMVLASLVENHPSVPIYIRGDANVNPHNAARQEIFATFLESHSLNSLPPL